MYKVVRSYFNGGRTVRRTLEKNLTLEEARKHCDDPETSSQTCTLPSRKRITRKHGQWFDYYTEM